MPKLSVSFGSPTCCARSAIIRPTPEARNLRHSKRIEWLTGQPLKSDFPDAAGIRRFFDSQSLNAEAEREFWFAYLLRTLRNHIDALPVSQSDLLQIGR